MENQEGTFLKAAGIGAAVVFISVSLIALLMVLVPGAFSGTIQERLVYIADNSLVAALPWFIACVWAAAEIPVALGLHRIARKLDSGVPDLGIVFYLLGICVRFIASAMLLGIVGSLAWAGVSVSTFGLVDAVAVCLEGAGLLVTSVALLLIGIPLTKEKGFIRLVAWLLVVSAGSLIVGVVFKVIVLMGVAIPAAIDIIATILLGPVAVLTLIAAFALLSYALWSRLTVGSAKA